MAITVNVNGVTSGGGSQGGSTTQPTSQGQTGYSRPDFSNYTAADKSQPNDILPSSDRLAGDIVNEMQQRGISFVPGTANYDNVLDTLKGQQRESLLGSVDKRYNDRMSDIDVRRDSLMSEIQSRIESSRKAELDATTDEDEIKKINEKYDKLFDVEEKDASDFFQKEYDAEEKRHEDELVEIEKRLADAVDKLVNNTQGTTTPQPTSQGNQGNAQGGSQGTTQAQGGIETPVQPPTQPANDGTGQGSQGSQSQTQQGQGAGGNGSQRQGGGQNQPPTPPTPPPFIPYARPDFEQYKPNLNTPGGTVLPTSDRMVNDIRAEITRRGVMMIPGTQNFNTMMTTLQQQQRSNVMGQIDNQRDSRLQDLDRRADLLMDEIKTRVEVSRGSELASADPLQVSSINKRWDAKLERERTAAGAMFEQEEAVINAESEQQKAEAEENLTEAIKRLTEELSQGNKDSYLNQLREKYKEQVWNRDNAATEEEVREWSREAAKTQERMQRAMNPGASQETMHWLGAAGTIASSAINTAVQLDRLGIRDDYVGLSMASSVLNGNATAAIRQRNQIKEQQNSALWGGIGTAGGAAAGALIGSAFGGVGAIPGWAIGALIGTLAGTGIGAGVSHLANRSMFVEDERTQVADLWKQEEQRMMGFNDLTMLMRNRFVNPNNIEGIRDYYISKSGEDSNEPIWGRSELNLDLYDLGYTAPEFAQQVSKRIKQRGFTKGTDSAEYALEADALERIFSMNSGSLGQLSSSDRFWHSDVIDGKRYRVKNNANRDFTNLAYTLAGLSTIGMEDGSWARSDEFAGYMNQLQSSQRSVFLTADNSRAARQIATGEKMFQVRDSGGNVVESRFGAEAMRGIQAVNNQVQNPGGGFAKTLLYDVIQELYPDTRGDLRKIKMAQYDPSKQNRIQVEYAKRIASIYGDPNTTSGFLAFQEIYGIDNPNILNPIANQMVRGGGLEAVPLDKSHDVKDVTRVLANGYTPEITQKMNALADKQMNTLLNYQGEITRVVNNILQKIETDIADKLKEAVDNLK